MVFHPFHVFLDFEQRQLVGKQLGHLVQDVLIGCKFLHREAEAHEVVRHVLSVEQLHQLWLKFHAHHEDYLAVVDCESQLERMHHDAKTRPHFVLEFLDVLLDVGRDNKLVEHARVLVLLEQLHLFARYIRQRRVEYRKQLAAETRQYGQSASAEHDQHKCIVQGPLNVVHLQVGLAPPIEWRAFILLLKIKQLHTCTEVVFKAYEQQLAVEDVLTIRNDGYQVVLVVRPAD